MGENNSKPEYPLHKEKITESHDAVGEGNGRYEAKFNYSTTNAALHPNEDLIRALIVENRMKNEEIKMERIKMETEIRTRFREKERKLKEQADIMKRQKKEQEITKQAIETEKKTSVDRRNPKFISNTFSEFPEIDTVLRVRDTPRGSPPTYTIPYHRDTHIKDQAETIKKQNEVMENRKCIEKQLLGNLVNTDISKLKCTTAKKNPKPITQQLNDYPNYRRDRETVPDIRPLKINDESNIKEQKSGKYKKNKNKQRNVDLKKHNGEHNTKSNTRSGGTKYYPFQSQKQVHMNPDSNQSIAVRNNQNEHQTSLPAVTKSHFSTQPPPAYSSHSFHTFDSSAASPSAANYPQHHPVYNIPPPSYSSTPQNKSKASNNKLNGDEQHDNKFLKGNRKQRANMDVDGAKKLRNKNRGITKF